MNLCSNNSASQFSNFYLWSHHFIKISSDLSTFFLMSQKLPSPVGSSLSVPLQLNITSLPFCSQDKHPCGHLAELSPHFWELLPQSLPRSDSLACCSQNATSNMWLLILYATLFRNLHHVLLIETNTNFLVWYSGLSHCLLHFSISTWFFFQARSDPSNPYAHLDHFNVCVLWFLI